MNFRGITVLLPGHGWEEVASLERPADASALLSGVTAAWHPAVVHAVAGIPAMQPIFDIEHEIVSQIVIVPGMAESGFGAVTLDDSNRVVRPAGMDRVAFSQALLHALGMPPEQTGAPGGELVRDFWALGYTYLQIKLLTYRLHYSSGLDEAALAEVVVSAAKAAIENDPTSCSRWVNDAHRLLMVERSHYYPVDCYLLDIALIAESRSAATDDLDLASEVPLNVMMTGRALERIADQRPELLTALQNAVAQGNVCLLGGELAEPPWFLMSCESALASLRLGRERFRQHLAAVPTQFARRRFGLSPLIVQALVGLDYQGTIQAALDAGLGPTSSQPRTRWALPDATSINALGKFPLDVGDAANLCRIGACMAASMDRDYLATVAMVRWAHDASDWWRDLRRGGGAGEALGKFATLSEYFRADCHQLGKEAFDSDGWVSPYLSEMVAKGGRDPVSQWIKLTQAQLALEEARSLAALASSLGMVDAAFEHRERTATEAVVDTQAEPDQVSQLTHTLRTDAAARFAHAVVAAHKGVDPAGSAHGIMLINPLGFGRRLHLQTPHRLARPPSALAWWNDDLRTEAVVQLPAFGYLYLPTLAEGDQTGETQQSCGPALADGLVLRNEFLEAHVHPGAGGIRAIYDDHTRGNRVSQRLTCRWPSKFGPATQTRTEVTSIELSHCNDVSASIQSRGQLFAGDAWIGDFQQTMKLVRGQRRLALDIHLEMDQAPEGDPWMNYWSSTLALPDPSADLFRAVNWQRARLKSATQKRRLESCWYLDWLHPRRRTTLLTGGLPFHVQHEHLVDTILCSDCERARDFRLAVALDASDALRESLDFLSPPVAVEMQHPPATSSGWLLHVDARHVMVTAVEPLFDLEGVVEGLRVRLLEAGGGSGFVTIRTFHPVSLAQQCSLGGQPLRDCELTDGAARLRIQPHEWTQVELRW